jgi:hypothetical protein
MSDPPLIYYWGAPGVGRFSSVRCIIGGHDRPLFRGDADHAVETALGTVVLRFSSAATKYYYAAEDSDRPAAVWPALQRLAEAAGVVFVADSQDVRSQNNIAALGRLRADLALYGINLDQLPVVFQLNKRDLPDIMPVERLRSELATGWCEYVESVASDCIGVTAAFATILQMVSNRPLS